MQLSSMVAIALMPVSAAFTFTHGPVFTLVKGSAITLREHRPRAGHVHAGLLNALRSLRKVEQKPQIAVGSSIPDVDVELVISDGLAEAAGVAAQAKQEGAPDRATLSLVQVVGDKTTIILGMPGAFTPTCTDLHLPGYIESEEDLLQRGIDQIALITTNDVHVNRAWLKEVESCVGKTTRIGMIADGDGDAVRELGMAADMGFGLGARSKRFALVVDQGKVKHVAVDDGMEDLKATSAEEIMKVMPTVVPKAKEVADAEESKSAIAVAGLALAAAAAYYYSTTGGAGPGA